jgi:hypothetical protein
MDCDPNPLNSRINPIRMDKVGHGIKPTGETYRYLNIDPVSIKCG